MECLSYSQANADEAMLTIFLLSCPSFVCSSFNIDRWCNSHFCRGDELSLLFQFSLSRRVLKQHNSSRYHHTHLYLMHLTPHSLEKFSKNLWRQLQPSHLQSIRKFYRGYGWQDALLGHCVWQLWLCCFYMIHNRIVVAVFIVIVNYLNWVYTLPPFFTKDSVFVLTTTSF